MKVIPDLMIHKIERQNPFEYEAAPHPSIEENKKIKETIEANLLKIHNACIILKGSNIDAWKIYEEALLSLYVNAKNFQNSGFFHLIAQRVDPQYYTYTQIYSSAQVEILESILSVSQVPVENLKIIPKKKSNKIVDFFLKCVNRYR